MSVAPQLDKDWSFCALTGSLGAESLTRTKVGCENFRLNCAKWYPKFPVAPIISTLLFFSSMFFFFPKKIVAVSFQFLRSRNFRFEFSIFCV
jgi:hypothetical protein